MAMDPKCRAAVRAAAAGRQISDAKIDLIEQQLRETGQMLARQDPERWIGLTTAQRTREIAAAAMDQVKAEALRKEWRASLQVTRSAQAGARIEAAMALNQLTRSQGLIRDIENTGHNIEAVRNEAMSGLGDMIDAAESADGTGALRRLGMRLFDLDNPRMTADVVREIFRNADGSTGNAAARAGAKAWLATIERMRVRFNESGGNIGRLAYGYLSQAHDQVKVLTAGAEAWADAVLPLLDRRQYVNADGSRMTDAQVGELLRNAWKTLATGGDNKVDPGQFRGQGARANRGSDHRVLHFADGDAWMRYMEQFGQGSLYDAMVGHVGRMARDIGLVEAYGPNPEQTFRVLNDLARRDDAKGKIGDFLSNRSAGNTPQAYWDLVSGVTGTPVNPALARAGQSTRNVLTAAKLGGAVISSLTDVATIAQALHFNRLGYFEMLQNVKGQADPQVRDFLQAHGIIAESLASSLGRWSGEAVTSGISARFAGAVMKVQLLGVWTDGLRGAFSQTLMAGLARTAKKNWAQLDEWDRYLLQRKGLTEDDWNIISKAQPTEFEGRTYLTGEAVRATGLPGADQAATKLLGFIVDEGQFAVTNPDMATRAITTAGGRPAGTVGGELARSVAQFKSFPLAQITRHWRRMLETPQGLEGAPALYGANTRMGALSNRMMLLAVANVTGMMLGAVVLQVKSLLQGKDPADMTEGKFWLRSLAQGGGMGYPGDLLLKDPTESRSNTAQQAVGSVLGPTAGTAAGILGDLVVTNAWQAAKGKDTDLGAEALRMGIGLVPGNNLWWSRPLFDRWFLFAAQEALNPGYLGRMQQRAMKDYGQGFWWSPDEALPDRAPNFEGMVGQ
tara:strand:+ start:21005 stop:23548 length:2544 start_codon:yes stop_codon:yes gene_type:complete